MNNVETIMNTFHVNGMEVIMKSENHIKIFSKRHNKYVNYYPSTGKFNLDGCPSEKLQTGVESCIKFIKNSDDTVTITESVLSDFKQLHFKKLHPDAFAPFKKFDTDAGFDISALYDTDWVRHDNMWYAEVKSGISMEVPKGYCLITAPRSSTLYLSRQFVFTSIIDTGYTGEITFLVQTLSDDKPPIIKRGDRLAQVVYLNIPNISKSFIETQMLPEHSPRGSKGFGHTGTSSIQNVLEEV